MNHYTISFFLQKNQALVDFEFQLILYSRIETARHLVRSDFFFAKVYTNFEIRRRVPRLKKQQQKLTKFNKTLSLSLSLSLSLLMIRRWNVYFDVPAPTSACVCVSISLSLSLSLSTFANTVWIQIRPEWYSGNLKMCACGGKYAKR